MQQFVLRRVLLKLVPGIGSVAAFSQTCTHITVGRSLVLVRNIHTQNSTSYGMKANKELPLGMSNTECGEQGLVQVSLSDGSELHYPWLWLRDNCQCSACYNPQMHSRTIHWRYFDLSVKPTTLSVTADVLNIGWSDGHQSQYMLSWLQERSFTQEAQDKWISGTYKLPRVPWGSAKFHKILKRFCFQDVIKKDSALLAWLQSLAVFGVAIVTDTPPKEDQLRRLANRVSFIKRTHYGEEFEVRNKPDTTNLAYLSNPLQMHTDLPYYDYKPGVNMLHCLVQTEGEGGDNQLTDCLHVSNHLKIAQPDTYHILSSTPIEWSDIGEESGDKFNSLHRSPVICEDRWGEFKRVNYSQQQRDSHFSVPLEDVIPWYKAYAVFTQAMYHPDNMVQFKTRPGDILTFDNVRMVHGRSGYNDTSVNERHLIGAYLDWDIAYSRIRVLQQCLNKC